MWFEFHKKWHHYIMSEGEILKSCHCIINYHWLFLKVCHICSMTNKYVSCSYTRQMNSGYLGSGWQAAGQTFPLIKLPVSVSLDAEIRARKLLFESAAETGSFNDITKRLIYTNVLHFSALNKADQRAPSSLSKKRGFYKWPPEGTKMTCSPALHI